MQPFRHLLILASATVLSACFPAKEITQENAETILSATSRVSQVSTKTMEGFTSSEINNQSLQRILTSTARTLTGKCYNNQGSYLLSHSGDDAFSMVFDHCSGADNGKVDGTLNGTFVQTGDLYEVNATGDLVASKNGNTITYKPIELTLSFLASETEASISIAHSGVYGFNTRLYKGDVNVETQQAVGYDFGTNTVTGIVNYTDASGNTLTVEHDNNGVHLSFNGTFFKTYSHSEWIKKFS